MTDTTITRRGFLGAVAGAGARALVATGGGLVIAGALPGHAGAAGLCPVCRVAPHGPLHQFLYATAPDPVWQDRVIGRESAWVSWAKNPRSTASGLAQFLDTTWNWGQELYGIEGSPFDPYASIRMMNAFIADGGYSHWALTGGTIPRGVPVAAAHHPHRGGAGVGG